MSTKIVYSISFDQIPVLIQDLHQSALSRKQKDTLVLIQARYEDLLLEKAACISSDSDIRQTENRILRDFLLIKSQIQRQQQKLDPPSTNSVSISQVRNSPYFIGLLLAIVFVMSVLGISHLNPSHSDRSTTNFDIKTFGTDSDVLIADSIHMDVRLAYPDSIFHTPKQ
ncbi:MAG: hypothetical protein AAF587_32670 [Bacteroidota bacterium]